MPTALPATARTDPKKTRIAERRVFPHFNANLFESRGFRDIAGGGRRGDNPQYQLTKAEYPAAAPFNAEIHSWSYDSIGNRLTNTVNATTQNYTYLKNGQNPLNGQKLANDGANAYTYDFNGNTLTRTGYGFAYDAENRLTSITGSETASYTYDYQGRRTSKTVAGVTTTYLYDGLNLIAETAAGQTSYFLNGSGIDEPHAMSKAGNVSYFSVDGLGSVVATNDATGTVTHSLVFDAWGNTKSEVGTRIHPFTYTGREVGEAGQLFYRARFFQPTIGRFGAEDPIATGRSRSFYGDSLPLDLNPYRYVLNRPSVLTDPRGLTPEEPKKKCSGRCPECPSGLWWGYGLQASGIGIPDPFKWELTFGGSLALQEFKCPSGRVACLYLIACGVGGAGVAASFTGGLNFAFNAHCSDDIAGASMGGNIDAGAVKGGSADIGISSTGTVTTSVTAGFAGGVGGGATKCQAKKLTCRNY